MRYVHTFHFACRYVGIFRFIFFFPFPAEFFAEVCCAKFSIFSHHYFHYYLAQVTSWDRVFCCIEQEFVLNLVHTIQKICFAQTRISLIQSNGFFSVHFTQIQLLSILRSVFPGKRLKEGKSFIRHFRARAHVRGGRKRVSSLLYSLLYNFTF